MPISISLATAVGAKRFCDPLTRND